MNFPDGYFQKRGQPIAWFVSHLDSVPGFMGVEVPNSAHIGTFRSAWNLYTEIGPNCVREHSRSLLAPFCGVLQYCCACLALT